MRTWRLKATKQFSVIVLALLLCSSSTPAETLVLPDSLTAVAEQAFTGDTSIDAVILPDNTVSIGKEAFAGCSSLEWISIPESVTVFDDGCLDNCAEDLLIQTVKGSAACSFARSRGIDYQADTVYRALLIGQTYPNDPARKLEGPANDIPALRDCLKSFSRTPYQVTVLMDLTAEEIVESIQSTFSGAKEEDVSLFYYSGHGINTGNVENLGALLGTDNDSVSPARLRTILDQVPGRKIVIADACCSGNLLSETPPLRSSFSPTPAADPEKTENTAPAETFTNAFISAFSRRSRGLSAESFFVLTSAAAGEDSYEEVISGKTMGLFSWSFLKGCGYSILYGAGTSMPADRNTNAVLTVEELYQYTRSLLLHKGQHVQVYPASCNWFGILRQ